MMRMDRVSRETQKNGLAEPAAECSKTRDHKTSAAKVLLRLFQDRHSQSRGRQPLVARSVLYMILLVARSHHDTSIVLDLLLRQGSSSRLLCFCWPHLAISAQSSCAFQISTRCTYVPSSRRAEPEALVAGDSDEFV
jgi:hypothetical protein